MTTREDGVLLWSFVLTQIEIAPEFLLGRLFPIPPERDAGFVVEVDGPGPEPEDDE